MGCTISAAGVLDPEQNKELWELAEGKEKVKVPATSLKITHSNWRTIRVFVTSTFKDFKSEREQLHAKVLHMFWYHIHSYF
jgi:hypothetical protein